jgi:hypothetical protein
MRNLDLTWRQSAARVAGGKAPPHFVVDEREIKIDIASKGSALEGAPGGINVVSA